MSETETNFDLIIIGAGPGGYTGAIRAAQLGMKVAVIEKDKTLGGTCLNVGCIPSKALLESTEYFHMAQHDFKNHGIEVGSPVIDIEKMQARKAKIVKDLTGGIGFLFKKNKITPFNGVGRIVKPGVVEVKSETGTQTLQGKNIMCATGSVVAELPFLKFDEKQIVSSTGALEISKVPKHLVVVGGGVIGLELGSVWLRLGAKVTVVEYSDRICPFMDQQIIQVLRRSLEKQGMTFITSAKVTASKKQGEDIELTYEDMKDQSSKTISGDIVLVSTGRRPYSSGLGLQELGVEMDKQGRVLVDHHFQTNVNGIYAIGDLIPGPMLAHKAEEEGVAVAEILAGQAGHVNYNTVPSVIYTFPEVASVGYTEEQVKEKGLAYNVGTFPFTPNARAKALGTTEGLVKIIADAKSDKIIGGHIVGPRASELLGELVISMEFGGSSEDLARSFHAHPTLNEVVREAALAVQKRARQM